MKLYPPSFLIVALATMLAWLPHARGEAPPNDQFASPTVITGDPSDATVFASGSTVDATVEPDEPPHARTSGGASIWFEWTAPSSGTVSVDLAGSNFDTVLAIYVGTELDRLRLVVYNDDGDHDTGAGSPS